MTEDYVPSMRDREDEISTYIGAGVAIPHSTAAGKKHVQRDALAVLALAEPVDWGDGQQVVPVRRHRRPAATGTWTSSPNSPRS